ncbi:hypothetical protein PCANC_23129 [Puccinia coronata f. sp. avenae]|uniref:Uncharacterized protein n=1 Tax=Puccinia coronata f. sp. avenae TaxID=200324 RepID=A0A2N5U0E7_9BASI|nr:hypothetical protein PCANC_23129 [Puccinia coronata f. sp. avenae]
MSAPCEFAPAADATTQNQSNPSLKMFAPRAFAPLALQLCTLADPCAISQPRSQERLPLPIEKIDLSRRYLRTSQLVDENQKKKKNDLFLCADVCQPPGKSKTSA